KKFKQWGFVKYRMRKEDWRCISTRIDKRKRESGKDSEVYIDGVQCPPTKVRRETARHGFVSTIEKFRPAPSPKIPEGIVVCSPGPSAAQLKWDQTLPWFQFLRLI
ncbi:hypothetical protein BKA61DRAFT_448990, partial [Leptodontidium sp. MPI-SDFR-AT-0119]